MPSSTHPFKGRKSVVLVYSQSCATITTMQFWGLFTASRRNPNRNHFLFFSSVPHFLPTPSSRQSLIYFLFSWICLFGTFHINGIIQQVLLSPFT